MAEQNRLGSAPSRLQTDIQAHITWRNKQLARLDDDIDTTRRASPVWREREELWRSVPGIGPACTRTLRLDRPALGTVSRQRLAALVGVAPLPLERGTRRGRRTIWGGRAHVRATGKTAKVALAACMCTLLTILNAMVQHHTLWQPQEGLGA